MRIESLRVNEDSILFIIDLKNILYLFYRKIQIFHIISCLNEEYSGTPVMRVSDNQRRYFIDNTSLLSPY